MAREEERVVEKRKVLDMGYYIIVFRGLMVLNMGMF